MNFIFVYISFWQIKSATHPENYPENYPNNIFLRVVGTDISPRTFNVTFTVPNPHFLAVGVRINSKKCLKVFCTKGSRHGCCTQYTLFTPFGRGYRLYLSRCSFYIPQSLYRLSQRTRYFYDRIHSKCYSVVFFSPGTENVISLYWWNSFLFLFTFGKLRVPPTLKITLKMIRITFF